MWRLNLNPFFGVILLLLLLCSVVAGAQDISQSIKSESYWKDRCMSAEEVLRFVFQNSNLSEETYQEIENLLSNSQSLILNSEEIWMMLIQLSENSGAITNLLIEKFNFSEEEAMRIENSLKDILLNMEAEHPQEKTTVNKGWRTSAFIEGLLLIISILVIIIIL